MASFIPESLQMMEHQEFGEDIMMTAQFTTSMMDTTMWCLIVLSKAQIQTEIHARDVDCVFHH